MYINIFDCTSFFHQWLVKIIDRHKLIVVSHKNSEQWNVVVMSYRNSFIYIQRQIDRILRVFRVFAKTYVDDIVIFNYTLKKHLQHFHQIFLLFDKLNITFKFSKIYLSYSIISLLNQKINRFEVFIVQKKLVAILRFKFFRTLKNLKIYLNIIDYLRDYVTFYTQKIDVLRQRKIMLLKNVSFNKERVKKNFNRRISVHDSSLNEMNFYNNYKIRLIVSIDWFITTQFVFFTSTWMILVAISR